MLFVVGRNGAGPAPAYIARLWPGPKSRKPRIAKDAGKFNGGCRGERAIMAMVGISISPCTVLRIKSLPGPCKATWRNPLCLVRCRKSRQHPLLTAPRRYAEMGRPMGG